MFTTPLFISTSAFDFEDLSPSSTSELMDSSVEEEGFNGVGEGAKCCFVFGFGPKIPKGNNTLSTLSTLKEADEDTKDTNFVEDFGDISRTIAFDFEDLSPSAISGLIDSSEEEEDEDEDEDELVSLEGFNGVGEGAKCCFVFGFGPKIPKGNNTLSTLALWGGAWTSGTCDGGSTAGTGNDVGALVGVKALALVGAMATFFDGAWAGE
ncbi:hypothetical protein G4B88_020885 [Cannabis sativa]|uniref:Uncharacterized protein n=1 Tax=Cannabis sativa TaxID=3483 RepID=A0A7J6FES4_CANSA|nr:hypothetical protein G4B88_020885 [Cannabis sativa]